jgi:hypothetical protein
MQNAELRIKIKVCVIPSEREESQKSAMQFLMQNAELRIKREMERLKYAQG